MFIAWAEYIGQWQSNFLALKRPWIQFPGLQRKYSEYVSIIHNSQKCENKPNVHQPMSGQIKWKTIGH
jgi:hypothetical protein